MLPENVTEFVSQNHQAVLTTFRRNGAAQMSIVTVGAYGDGVGFTTTEDRAKLRNLIRDSRCSLLISKSDWWGYVVLEGNARLLRRGESTTPSSATPCAASTAPPPARSIPIGTSTTKP